MGILLVIALAIYLAFDQLAAASLYLPFTIFYVVFWLVVGKVLLWTISKSQQLLALAFFLVAVLIIHQTNWDSRKPFLRNFRQLEPGMTAQEVDQVMRTYEKFVPATAELNKQNEVLAGTVSFHHTTQGWGNADIGLVVFADGQVVATHFYPD
jgi:hypothetical protein